MQTFEVTQQKSLAICWALALTSKTKTKLARLMMELMFYNTKMVQQCYNLFAVEENIDEMLLDDDDWEFS